MTGTPQIDIISSVMEFTIVSFLILLASGFFVGILGSVLGIGGGIFLVPVLVLYFGVPIHQAVATSLMAIIAASSAVASVNVERGLANMRLGIFFEISTAMGSIAGALVSSRLPASAVQTMFAAVLVPTALVMLRRGLLKKDRGHGQSKPQRGEYGRFSSSFFDPATGSNSPYGVKNTLPAFVMSFFGGSLSGLLGIGGGIIHVPVMNVLCGMPIKAAAATSNFMLGVSAAASAVIFYRHGLIRPELTAVIVLGVLAGSMTGVRVLYRARGERLQAVFGIVLLIVAARMFVKAAG